MERFSEASGFGEHYFISSEELKTLYNLHSFLGLTRSLSGKPLQKKYADGIECLADLMTTKKCCLLANYEY